MPRSHSTANADTRTDMGTSTNDFLVPDRSNSIDVTDPKQASALLAMWRGVYWFYNGRADWNIDENGNVSAMNFTTRADFDPAAILNDVAGKARRLEFGPAYLIVNGQVPPEFTDPQDITNFQVNYAKGSSEDGTTKNPPYLRTGIDQYKSEHGLQTRRGRKKKILRLDNLATELDEETLRAVKPEDLDKLIAFAEAARNRTPAGANA